VSDHDRSKNEAQHQQGERLQFIERIHGCLRGKGSGVRSQVLGSRCQESEIAPRDVAKVMLAKVM
jgi:hypothetical protein